MIRAVVLLMVLAPAAMAQGVLGEQALIDAIVAAGCIVTEANEASVLAASGLNESQAAQVVMKLMADGRAVPQDDDLRLMTGTCN